MSDKPYKARYCGHAVCLVLARFPDGLTLEELTYQVQDHQRHRGKKPASRLEVFFDMLEAFSKDKIMSTDEQPPRLFLRTEEPAHDRR